MTGESEPRWVLWTGGGVPLGGMGWESFFYLSNDALKAPALFGSF